MRVLLYSTTDCGLCDAFHYELLDLQAELGFVYEKRHLQKGDSLYTEFRALFPVVEIATGNSDKPIRLASPTSQRQLAAQIREYASRALPARTG